MQRPKKIENFPPLLQPEMPTEGVKTGRCDQPLNRFICSYRSISAFIGGPSMHGLGG